MHNQCIYIQSAELVLLFFFSYTVIQKIILKIKAIAEKWAKHKNKQ